MLVGLAIEASPTRLTNFFKHRLIKPLFFLTAPGASYPPQCFLKINLTTRCLFYLDSGHCGG